MRVIGIDPGLTRTGFAIVEREGARARLVDMGVVRTSPAQPAAARLAELRAAITEVLGAGRPGVAAVERLFFNANVRTAMAVGQAAGVVLASAAEAGVDVATYTPTEVKQSVAGHGAAPKSQVAAMVASALGLAAAPRPADAADACALALCHLNRAGLDVAIAKARR